MAVGSHQSQSGELNHRWQNDRCTRLSFQCYFSAVVIEILQISVGACE